VSEHALLRVDEILRSLSEAGARFVLIGGLAAQVHGSPSLTGDVDICFATDGVNLHRLAGALREMAAVRRGMPDGVVAPIDDGALRAGDVFTLTTRFGDLDLLAHPAPGLDFDLLAADAMTIEIMGRVVQVASLDDLMAMKRAAGRPKDRIELEVLGALREEIDRRPG
jgi:predicted nucleotidyltransferase